MTAAWAQYTSACNMRWIIENTGINGLQHDFSDGTDCRGMRTVKVPSRVAIRAFCSARRRARRASRWSLSAGVGGRARSRSSSLSSWGELILKRNGGEQTDLARNVQKDLTSNQQVNPRISTFLLYKTRSLRAPRKHSLRWFATLSGVRGHSEYGRDDLQE